MDPSFYDDLAPFHHLLYADWEASVQRQGSALDALLRGAGVPAGAPILDAACGIGTQTLGLAERGYAVAASDLSSGAVARLRRELTTRGLADRVAVRVRDFRTLADVPDASYAAVLACDNAIPHLLTDEEILGTFRAFWRCIRPGGVAVLSVRDYAAIERRMPDVHPYGIQRTADGRFLAVQAWEWDGDYYDLRMYLIQDHDADGCRTRVLHSRYYAVPIRRLLTLLRMAGFVDVARRDDVLFQPVLIGYRSGAA